MLDVRAEVLDQYVGPIGQPEEDLGTVRRREVGERIKEAKEFGDISENSEYDDAKNEQAWVESRIAEIGMILANATVIVFGLSLLLGALFTGQAVLALIA